jgi:type I restriction enzyme S subunit
MSLPRYPKYQESGIEWLGPIPVDWEVVRLKHVALVKMGQSPSSEDCNQEGIGVPFLQGNSDFGEMSPEPRIYCDCAVKMAMSGDLLFSVRAPVGAINIADQIYGIGRGLCAIRAAHEVHSTYLRYMMELARVELFSVATGSTYEGVSVEQVGNVRIVRPSWSEQVAIATFLTRETAKIDALVAEQENLITLLAEKRQAVTSHAVARGVSPNARMKDSGVPWLGEVPTHWTVCAVRHVLTSIEQGWSPECVNRPAEGREWGVLKAGCVNGGTFSPNENKALPEALTPNQDIEVRNGDLLMSRASGSPALVGSIAYVSEPPPRLMLSDKIFRIHLQPVVSPRFFAAAFASRYLRHQIEQAISGAEGLANNLSQSSLKSFTIAVPPADEQTKIVAFVEAEIARLGALTAEAERVIALLKERRNALISATVTGQINAHGIVSQSAVREELAA